MAENLSLLTAYPHLFFFNVGIFKVIFTFLKGIYYVSSLNKPILTTTKLLWLKLMLHIKYIYTFTYIKHFKSFERQGKPCSKTASLVLVFLLPSTSWAFLRGWRLLFMKTRASKFGAARGQNSLYFHLKQYSLKLMLHPVLILVSGIQ